MAEYGNSNNLTAIASGDMTACQYHIVRYIGADRIFLASSNGALANAGVMLNAPNNDEHATVAILGSTKVIVGSAVSANDWFTANGSGRAITASIPASGSAPIMALGRVLSAGDPGEIVPCIIHPITLSAL